MSKAKKCPGAVILSINRHFAYEFINSTPARNNVSFYLNYLLHINLLGVSHGSKYANRP